MIAGFLFLSWRIFEIFMLLPPVGMLAYFVHGFVTVNQLTPDYILVLFIVSVLALAWAFFTTISYLRARHDAAFVALIDLGIVGALIAGVYYLRGYATANCTNGSVSAGDGSFSFNLNTNKECAMLKASFAFGIINILAFFVTFLLALLVAREHRNENDRMVVKRTTRRSSSHNQRRRSGSREYRSSRDYGYDNRPSSNSRRYQSNTRRTYV